jgi:hypothetical protein
MPTVLHIGSSETTWWEKSASGWEVAAGPSKGPVWVVTELSEETFVEIAVPRIFGADRRNFIDRQLSTRFPESAFRLALPARSTGSLMERLAPPVQTLTAVEPAERIVTALQSLQVPIAGVWSSSMLLTKLGRKTSLPKDLFVVLLHGGSMRILFLKQRAPVLTRLVAAAQTAGDQAAEVVRTLRHLENTRVVERGGQHFGLLLLGGAPGLEDAFSGERFDISTQPTPAGVSTEQHWNHVLFDLVCTNPPGQLAPVSYRASFLAIGVTKAARVGVAVTVVIALWFGGNSALSSLQSQRQSTQVQMQSDQVSSHIVKLEIDIGAFGVSPGLVRQALATDSEEIMSAPDMGAHLLSLSHVVGGVPGVHLKTMQWQLLNPGTPACAFNVASNPSAVPEPQDLTDPQPGRLVELQFSVVLAGQDQPRILAQQTAEISRLLKQVQGVIVRHDPALSLRDGSISVGASQVQNTEDLVWCVSLPGTEPDKTAKPKVLP